MTIHKCVRCGTAYKPGAGELFSGCPCGSRLFAFVKGDRAIELLEKVKPGEMKWLEEEINQAASRETAPTVFEEGEGVRVISKGCYAINVAELMAGTPVVIKASDGVYFLKLPQTNPKNSSSSNEATSVKNTQNMDG